MTNTRVFISLFYLFVITGCGTSPSTGTSPTGHVESDVAPQPLLVANGTLTLVIYSPLNDTVVVESPVEILGSVSSDSTLTLQGEAHILPPGDFALMVDLQPGRNELHFSVSSLLGNQVELDLVIFLESK